MTAAQAAVVAHGDAPLVVAGAPGSGKTTALAHRYLRLAAEHGAGRVLVLCRSRVAAARFTDAVLPRLRGGFDSLPVTTAWGLAFDRLQRRGLAPRLLGYREQRDVVERLLAAEGGMASLWPTLDGYVGQPAFADEVAGTLLDLQAELADPASVQAAADGAGCGDRWREVLAFAQRYQAELEQHGWVDGAGLLARAAAIGPDLDVGRFAAVLVDDHDGSGTAAARITEQLVAAGVPTVVAGDPAADLDHRLDAAAPGADVLELGPTFRDPGPPRLVRVPHPSLEPEAVAGALLDASARGVPWGEMAVLTRSAVRGQAIGRALLRNGIPVARPPAPVVDAPAVRALQDLLDLAQGDAAAVERLRSSPVAEVADPTALGAELEALGPVTDPVALAHHAFQRGLAHLVHPPEHPVAAADERALDAVVAWLTALERGADAGATPDPWVADAAGPDRVRVTTIDAAAGRDRHYQRDAVVARGRLRLNRNRHEGGRDRGEPRALQNGHRFLLRERPNSARSSCCFGLMPPGKNANARFRRWQFAAGAQQARAAQLRAAPTVSAMTAPRAPSGASGPTVESRAVWCSISALSCAPISTTTVQSHIHIITPTTAPSAP